MSNLNECYHQSKKILKEYQNNKIDLSKFFAELADLFQRSDLADSRTNFSVFRILVARLDEIGDVVMTSSFLRELRRNFPMAHITIVIKPQCRDLIDACPYVNQVLTFDSLAIRKEYGMAIFMEKLLQFCYSNLWDKRYDLFILPRYDHDMYLASFLGFMSGAQRRIAFSSNVTPWKQRQNKGFDSLFTDVIPNKKLCHEVEHNLEFIAFLGGIVKSNSLELWTNRSDETWADKRLEHLTSPIVAFSPGIAGVQKYWPVERCVQVGEWLKEHYNASFILLGSEGEEDTAQKLSDSLSGTAQVVDLTSKTTLRQSSAVLRRCSLYIGRDTGLMHMAAAAGIGVVDITCHPKTDNSFHIMNPVRFGPWGPNCRVVQPEEALAPCSGGCQQTYNHCINQISANDVLKLIPELIKSVLSKR